MTWSDKQLKSHKKAQAGLSAAGATLGVSALGAVAARAGAPRAVKLAQRAGKLKRVTPKEVENFRGKASGYGAGLTTGSAGVGGIGGFNFAGIQAAESKRRVSKMSGGMDFGLGQVHQGEISKARTRHQAMQEASDTGFFAGLAGGAGAVAGRHASKWGATGYKNQRTAGAPRLKALSSGARTGGVALRRVPRGKLWWGAAAGGLGGSLVGSAVGGARHDRSKKKVSKAFPTKAVLRPVKQAATLGRDAKTGVKVIGQDYKTHGYGQAKRTAGVVAGATKGNIKANKQGAGLIAGSATAVGAGGAGAVYGVRKGLKPIKVSPVVGAGKLTRKVKRNIGKPGYNMASTSEFQVKRRPTKALKYTAGGVGAAGLGAGGYGYARSRQPAVAKAYNPEQKRKRRLDRYSTGATTAAVGLAGATGAYGHKTYKQGKLVHGLATAKKFPMRGELLRAGVKGTGRTGAVTAALGMGAVGAAVGADRIRSYKRGNGRTYRPLHTQI